MMTQVMAKKAAKEGITFLAWASLLATRQKRI